MTTDETKTGKVWTSWATFFRDHTRFMVELPGYLAAYLWPGRSLDPIMLESVMLTVNSVNTCPYCTGLHGQLARMAGAEPDAQAPAVKYAATFAHEAGRGADERAAFESLSKELGERKASSVRSLCWALLWGKTTGSQTNGAEAFAEASPIPLTTVFRQLDQLDPQQAALARPHEPHRPRGAAAASAQHRGPGLFCSTVRWQR